MTAQAAWVGLKGDIADLVEEDAAAVGDLEEPLLRVDRARERAFHVAEQVRLEQVRREAARVHRDEGSIGSRRVRVDGPRDQFLAGAALPFDQDRRPARRRLDDQVEHSAHRRALADDVVEAVVALLQVLPERPVLGDEPPALDGVPQDEQDLVVLERFGDVVEGAALHGVDGGVDRRVGGDHDDGHVVVDLLQFVQDGKAVHARHHHVDDGGVERHRAGQVEALGAV